MYSERALKIDVFFHHLKRHLFESRINPTNLEEVRKKFFTRKYNPTFTYKPYKSEITTTKGLLEVMNFDKTLVESILKESRDMIVQDILLQESIGTEKLTKVSAKIYPKPNARLVRIAQQILTLSKSPKDEKMRKTDAVKMLRKTIKEFDLDWEIKLRKLVTSANVNVNKKRLELNKGESLAKTYAARLAIHEIGTHVLRAANGALQPLDIFRSGLNRYLETEEGLAAYNEWRFGLMTNSTLRNYAGRVLAIHFAQQYDFKKTYKQLRKWFDKKMAFKLTVRAKRGLSDTSKPGGYTKDAVYLRGFLRVYSYAKKNDVSNLYLGKIGLDDLENVHKLKEIKEPKYLPDVLLQKEIILPSKLQVNKEEVIPLLK